MTEPIILLQSDYTQEPEKKFSKVAEYQVHDATMTEHALSQLPSSAANRKSSLESAVTSVVSDKHRSPGMATVLQQAL